MLTFCDIAEAHREVILLWFWQSWSKRWLSSHQDHHQGPRHLLWDPSASLPPRHVTHSVAKVSHAGMGVVHVQKTSKFICPFSGRSSKHAQCSRVHTTLQSPLDEKRPLLRGSVLKYARVNIAHASFSWGCLRWGEMHPSPQREHSQVKDAHTNMTSWATCSRQPEHLYR